MKKHLPYIIIILGIVIISAFFLLRNTGQISVGAEAQAETYTKDGTRINIETQRQATTETISTSVEEIESRILTLQADKELLQIRMNKVDSEITLWQGRLTEAKKLR